MSFLGKHGITSNTPEAILLGAGTYHKGLKFEGGKWVGEIIGATDGGGKLTIKGDLMDIPLDGALVKVKGLTVKQGGQSSMEVNYAEVNANTLKIGTGFKEGESDATGYTMLEDKPHIEEGDYVENFGFVGQTATGKNIIVVYAWALCTSGFEVEPKNKDNAVVKLTMEACADIEGDLDVLPVRIYYPTGQ